MQNAECGSRTARLPSPQFPIRSCQSRISSLKPQNFLHFQLHLQGVKVARHHVPESCGSGEFENILLADEVLDLLKELVIYSRLRGEVISITQDEFIFVGEKRAGLIRADAVDLRT